MQQRQVLPQTRPVDAEGFIGIRSLWYLAHWCDVVVLSQRVPNFVESGLGTGAKRHVFRCTNVTRDYGPCQSRVKAFGLQEEFWPHEEGPCCSGPSLSLFHGTAAGAYF